MSDQRIPRVLDVVGLYRFQEIWQRPLWPELLKINEDGDWDYKQEVADVDLVENS